MAYRNCFKDNEELFMETVTEFKRRRFLVKFLLQIILNIQDIWLRFCSCRKVLEKCSICLFYQKYKDQEYKFMNIH